jgi:hypothetical protein
MLYNSYLSSSQVTNQNAALRQRRENSVFCWGNPTGDVLIIAQTEGKAHWDTIFNVVRQNRLHPRESLYY